ncbi:uncharacterized protein LOC141907995 [Tubulanus polymorphus]|uniref:uncharacterized protein LOC141907995 n=1 Tax=Tubulanus polymorphus TaxID=672921 RepID=UPI003DA47C78
MYYLLLALLAFSAASVPNVAAYTHEFKDYREFLNDPEFNFIMCPMKCFCDDEKVYCRNANYTRIPQEFSKAISELALDGNRLQTLTRNSLDRYRYLRTLNLYDNHLDYIEPGTFTNLKYLRYLNLGRNRLEYLASSMFDGLHKLRTINLQANGLRVVPDVVKSFARLNDLNLGENRIVELPKDTFVKNPKIRLLNVSHNAIATMHREVLKPLTHLRYFLINDNPLGDAGSELDLTANRRLYFIDMSDTMLRAVPKNLPATLFDLRLPRNLIDWIYVEDFKNTTALDILILNNNAITHIDDAALVNSTNLRELWLNHNKLQRMPSLPSSLRSLYADFNEIYEIQRKTFASCPRLEFLSMQKNKIRDIEAESFKNLSLRSVDLSANRILELKTFTFCDLKNLEKLDLSVNPLVKLDAQSMHNVDNLRVLQMARTNEKSRREFDDGGSDLDMLERMAHLTHLDLFNSSGIAKKWIASRKVLRKVQDLNLMFNELITLPQDLPMYVPQIRNIKLAGNNWHCNASLIWFHYWIKRFPNLFFARHHIVCYTPFKLRYRPIFTVPVHEFRRVKGPPSDKPPFPKCDQCDDNAAKPEEGSPENDDVEGSTTTGKHGEPVKHSGTRHDENEDIGGPLDPRVVEPATDRDDGLIIETHTTKPDSKPEIVSRTRTKDPEEVESVIHEKPKEDIEETADIQVAPEDVKTTVQSAPEKLPEQQTPEQTIELKKTEASIDIKADESESKANIDVIDKTKPTSHIDVDNEIAGIDVDVKTSENTSDEKQNVNVDIDVKETVELKGKTTFKQLEPTKASIIKLTTKILEGDDMPKVTKPVKQLEMGEITNDNEVDDVVSSIVNGHIIDEKETPEDNLKGEDVIENEGVEDKDTKVESKEKSETEVKSDVLIDIGKSDTRVDIDVIDETAPTPHTDIDIVDQKLENEGEEEKDTKEESKEKSETEVKTEVLIDINKSDTKVDIDVIDETAPQTDIDKADLNLTDTSVINEASIDNNVDKSDVTIDVIDEIVPTSRIDVEDKIAGINVDVKPSEITSGESQGDNLDIIEIEGKRKTTFKELEPTKATITKLTTKILEGNDLPKVTKPLKQLEKGDKVNEVVDDNVVSSIVKSDINEKDETSKEDLKGEDLMGKELTNEKEFVDTREESKVKLETYENDQDEGKVNEFGESGSGMEPLIHKEEVEMEIDDGDEENNWGDATEDTVKEKQSEFSSGTFEENNKQKLEDNKESEKRLTTIVEETQENNLEGGQEEKSDELLTEGTPIAHVDSDQEESGEAITDESNVAKMINKENAVTDDENMDRKTGLQAIKEFKVEDEKIEEKEPAKKTGLQIIKEYNVDESISKESEKHTQSLEEIEPEERETGLQEIKEFQVDENIESPTEGKISTTETGSKTGDFRNKETGLQTIQEFHVDENIDETPDDIDIIPKRMTTKTLESSRNFTTKKVTKVLEGKTSVKPSFKTTKFKTLEGKSTVHGKDHSTKHFLRTGTTKSIKRWTTRRPNMDSSLHAILKGQTTPPRDDIETLTIPDKSTVADSPVDSKNVDLHKSEDENTNTKQDTTYQEQLKKDEQVWQMMGKMFGF